MAQRMSEWMAEVIMEEESLARHRASLSPFDAALWNQPSSEGWTGALAVKCPLCEAEPGATCLAHGRRPVALKFVHNERRALELSSRVGELEGFAQSWWTRHLRAENNLGGGKLALDLSPCPRLERG